MPVKIQVLLTATDEQLALLGLILSSVIVVSVIVTSPSFNNVTVYVSVSPTVIVEVLSSSALLVKALLRVGFAFAAKVIVLEASKAVGISVDLTNAVFLKVPASFSVWVIVKVPSKTQVALGATEAHEPVLPAVVLAVNFASVITTLFSVTLPVFVCVMV